jgi:chorismate synthase
MSANSFGERLRITTFGESHGTAVGVVIDGLPSGISFNHELLVKDLQRRRPGNSSNTLSSSIVSDRNEPDVPEILSGVFEGKTIGTPIAIIVKNIETRSKDYNQIKSQPRPGHADYVWKSKFDHVDHRGGGRSSGRETVARVMAGSVAQMFVKALYPTCTITSFASQIGPIQLSTEDLVSVKQRFHFPEDFIARFPSSRHYEVKELLEKAKTDGKSYGGIAQVWIENCPKNIGQPVFHKFKSDLSSALMSIGSTNAIEFGDGFFAASQEGSVYHSANDDTTKYGGILGGITTGDDIICRVSFKPTSSVLDVAKKGRHDPCIIPRAVPVLEAMAWITVADHILWCRQDRL